MPETVATILWRRLDVEGHEACRLVRLDEGWQLAGRAVFQQDSEPCCLAYRVTCDQQWRTRSARMSGFFGRREISHEIVRHADASWTLDGAMQPQLDGLIDVDVGFTPSTNLLAIRRFGLAAGQSAQAQSAYLAFPELRMFQLDQTYRRLDETHYAYESPVHGYHATLTVSPLGFVLDYPQLWSVVPARSMTPLAQENPKQEM